MSLSVILFALIGGVLPTLVWLWFWLREDKRHPEPPKLLLASFLLGACAVPIAIPLEQMASWIFPSIITTLIAWAIIEELLKYLAAYLGGMHTWAEDEPIDAMIYLITAALGFAAAENTLFLIDPLLTGDIFTGLVTANVRFVGTTLLHILASSVIGASIAFSFYRRKKVRIEHFLVGLVGAITLHAVFNFFILQAGSRGIFIIFLLIWICIAVLLLAFERIKRLRRRNPHNK